MVEWLMKPWKFSDNNYCNLVLSLLFFKLYSMLYLLELDNGNYLHPNGN